MLRNEWTGKKKPAAQSLKRVYDFIDTFEAEQLFGIIK